MIKIIRTNRVSSSCFNVLTGSLSMAVLGGWMAAMLLSGCARDRSGETSYPLSYRFTDRVDYAIALHPWARVDLAAPDADGYLQNGWGDVAGDGRQIQGRRAVLTLPVRGTEFPPDKSLSLTVRATPRHRSWRRQALQLRVNGRPSDRLNFDRVDGEQVLRFTVQPGALRPGLNEVELRFSFSGGRSRTAATVSSIALDPFDTAADATGRAAGPVVEFLSEDGARMRQSAGSVARWNWVVPANGTIRIDAEIGPAPAMESPVEAGLELYLLIDGRRRTLARADGADVTAEIAITARPGVRAAIESVAHGEVTWRKFEVHGSLRPEHVNVYLLTIDSLRHDHVGVYGATPSPTPMLDALAREGVFFDPVWATSNESLPSFASILTGRYPQSHGIMRNGLKLDAQQISLSTLMNRTGRRTAAIVNWPILSWGSMTGRDFTLRHFVTGTPATADLRDTRHNVYGSAVQWIRENRASPQFLWLHDQFLHLDHIAPPTHVLALKRLRDRFGEEAAEVAAARMLERGFRDVSYAYTVGGEPLSDVEIAYWQELYRAVVSYCDTHVERFWHQVKTMGLDPVSVLVVTSDHGTSLGEQGHLLHTGPPYEHLMRVPLLIRVPWRVSSGGRTDDADAAPIPVGVSTVDIAPTLLELTGRRPLRRMQGQSLAPLLRNAPFDPAPYLFAMIGRLPGRHYYAIRSMHATYWTNYTDAEGFTSFDDDSPEAADAMRHHLADVLERWVRQTPDVSPSIIDSISPEVRAMLEASGYLETRK